MVTRLLLIGACALGAFGCSEPVPPASQGAFYGAFQAPGGCNKDIHQAYIGYADSTEIRELRKNGVGGANVYCAVSPAGSGFDVEGDLQLGATNLRVIIKGIKPGTAAGDPHPGSVSYRTQETVRIYSSPQDTPCQFWFTNDEEVAAGRMWAQFTCEQINDASTDTSCALGESTIALQNCDQ